jgi:hypothetical protein
VMASVRTWPLPWSARKVTSLCKYPVTRTTGVGDCVGLTVNNLDKISSKNEDDQRC